jgi:hypothetical protein
MKKRFMKKILAAQEKGEIRKDIAPSPLCSLQNLTHIVLKWLATGAEVYASTKISFFDYNGFTNRAF